MVRKYFICGLFVCLFVFYGSFAYAWGWWCGGCCGGSCYQALAPTPVQGIGDKYEGCPCQEDCSMCSYSCETCPQKTICKKCPVISKRKSVIQSFKLKKAAKREMLEAEEHKVAESINKYRVAAGLTPLKIRFSEWTLARAHSKKMAEYGTLFHASGYMECLAMAPGYDPVALWVNSPVHYSIMMMPHATEMIVARHAFWWTLRVW